MSWRKKISQLLPDIIQTEDINNYKGKTLNNYRTNIIKNKIKNKSLASPSINTEINYYIDKIKITPKRNFGGYNTEKTEYSSQINDCLSKINGNSEIKPLFTNIKFNDSVSPIYKTETQNLYKSEKNIFITKNGNTKKNYRINIFPKKYNYNNNSNYNTSSCWYAKIDEVNSINRFNIEKIIKFSNIFLNSKTPKINKRKKFLKLNSNSKNKNKGGASKNNNRFNSLNCFIDNYIEIDENKILNRYNPKFDEYFGQLDYIKLIQKGKNLLTAKEKIKKVFKNTKLLMAMCDYLNTSLAKLKNEKRLKMKKKDKQIEEMKKNIIYKRNIETNLRNNIIANKEIFKMNNINKKNLFIKKAPIIYKNGCFSKYFYIPTSLSCNHLD